MGVVLPFPTRASASVAAHRTAISPDLRRSIEATIEALIEVLDFADGDTDLEHDADGEPSLGWSPTMALGTADDQEAGAPEWEGPTTVRRPVCLPHHSHNTLPCKASSVKIGDFRPVDSPAAT